MLLGLIFSILSVTYTIETSSNVSVSGTPPAGSEATYSRSGTTGQVGQMTAGNSTLLVLEGWDGVEIDSIVLQMRSNKSAGAGSLTMTIGDKTVWSIKDADFSHKTWHGSFTNEWTTISRWIGAKVPNEQSINIRIEASKNSLYIKSYSIYYAMPDPEPYDVSFESGVCTKLPILTEEYPGAGVPLPILPDTMPWYFLGWCEREVLEADTCPVLLQAGTMYYPNTDCTLWAVYSDSEENVMLPTTQWLTGEYVLMDLFWKHAMAGRVSGKYVPTVSVDLQESDAGMGIIAPVDKYMVYHVEFREDSLLRIKHVVTGEMIGYEQGELSGQSSWWHYRELNDGSLCVYQPYNTNYHKMLYFGYGADGMQDDIVAYAATVILEKVLRMGLWLYPYESCVYTTWPFGRDDAVENVIFPDFNGEKQEYIFRFGNYELHIQNGKKTLQIAK